MAEVGENKETLFLRIADLYWPGPAQAKLSVESLATIFLCAWAQGIMVRPTYIGICRRTIPLD